MCNINVYTRRSIIRDTSMRKSWPDIKQVGICGITKLGSATELLAQSWRTRQPRDHTNVQPEGGRMEEIEVRTCNFFTML
jgi:hypothetical protein